MGACSITHNYTIALDKADELVNPDNGSLAVRGCPRIESIDITPLFTLNLKLLHRNINTEEGFVDLFEYVKMSGGIRKKLHHVGILCLVAN